ncbi:glycosyltransferase family 2 protein [Nonlabens antarcticus]|uniref:glycosyltransferase family 2 protein n=1 Tax=Nonlabens antarcticus TaxID=392714 RepID=UPI001890EA88|nr:glycosyltransferase family 2 protein [Nonlabens antarcticus]
MISIIIPVYDRATLILETLKSISAQTYTNWECIIIDDQSADDTVKVITNFIKLDKRFKIYLGKKKGASACRNYGISKSSGNFIQFFDSDDIMHPKHLELKISVIEDFDFTICKIRGFRNDFCEDYFEKDIVKDVDYPKDSFKSFAIGSFHMCMVLPLWRSSFLKQFLPIREDLNVLEDRELHARILYTNPKFKIINRTLIYYRRDCISITNNFFKDIDYGLEAFLNALKTVLSLRSDDEIRLGILKKTLGFFRQALVEGNFSAASRCLKFTTQQKLWYSNTLKLKLIRILFFFRVLKILKRGETRFKFLFKI